MPIYEYECSSCHKTYEYLLNSNEIVNEYYCPECGHYLFRVMSTFNQTGSYNQTINNAAQQSFNSNSTLVRRPILQDRNTGEKFLGKPEILHKKRE